MRFVTGAGTVGVAQVGATSTRGSRARQQTTAETAGSGGPLDSLCSKLCWRVNAHPGGVGVVGLIRSR